MFYKGIYHKSKSFYGKGQSHENLELLNTVLKQKSRILFCLVKFVFANQLLFILKSTFILSYFILYY